MERIIVNGEVKEFSVEDFPATLLDLVKKIDLIPEGLIADVDGVVVQNTEFETFELKPESKIELVQFVGGG